LVTGIIAAQAPAESEILKLHREYEAALACQDASTLERLLADDYTYAPSNGSFMDKAKVLLQNRVSSLWAPFEVRISKYVFTAMPRS
jgi:Domain of unknown function (DUF4440)